MPPLAPYALLHLGDVLARMRRGALVSRRGTQTVAMQHHYLAASGHRAKSAGLGSWASIVRLAVRPTARLAVTGGTRAAERLDSARNMSTRRAL